MAENLNYSGDDGQGNPAYSIDILGEFIRADRQLVDSSFVKYLKDTILNDPHNWNSSKYNSDNEYGFSAKPGPYRYNDGTWSIIGYVAEYWSYSETRRYPDQAWLYAMGNDDTVLVTNNQPKTEGIAVRCIKRN